MTKILHIASSSNLTASFTRKIGKVTLEKLGQIYPNAEIIERDLARNPLPHISPEMLAAMFSGDDSKPELALSNQVVDELFASDVILIEAPMYNFGIPSVLKAWVDHVLRAGKTFKYGAAGPEGLVKGKKAIIVVSRGGIYSEGAYKVMDYQEPYLRAVLSFIGISDVEAITIEGVAMGEEKIAEALLKAENQVAKLSA